MQARAGLRRGFRVMGVDPGLSRLGYGFVEEFRGRIDCLGTGTIVSVSGPVPGRLEHVFRRLSELVSEWSPDALAVERVFLKVNLKTGVPSIQAGGVALLAGAMAGLEVAEYSPAEVKKATTGVGTAGKEQVRFMVSRLLSGSVEPDTPDAADALAVAITHAHCRREFGALAGRASAVAARGGAGT